ncbi:oxidoreductase, partial [Escherichia coli]|nr:oxidoreductase [Escherichia coli]
MRIHNLIILYEESVMVQRVTIAPQGPEFSRFVM